MAINSAFSTSLQLMLHRCQKEPGFENSEEQKRLEKEIQQKYESDLDALAAELENIDDDYLKDKIARQQMAIMKAFQIELKESLIKAS